MGKNKGVMKRIRDDKVIEAYQRQERYFSKQYQLKAEGKPYKIPADPDEMLPKGASITYDATTNKPILNRAPKITKPRESV